MKMIKKVIDIAHHRNGISGTSFNVVLFIDRETKEKFVGIVPDEDENSFNSFVLSVDRMGKDNIRFAENSWRGDNYTMELKAVIREKELREEINQVSTKEA